MDSWARSSHASYSYSVYIEQLKVEPWCKRKGFDLRACSGELHLYRQSMLCIFFHGPFASENFIMLCEGFRFQSNVPMLGTNWNWKFLHTPTFENSNTADVHTRLRVWRWISKIDEFLWQDDTKCSHGSRKWFQTSTTVDYKRKLLQSCIEQNLRGD